MLGSIFETHVLGQIVRHFANQGRRRDIYFYRDHQSREVDFLIPSAGRFELVECKWAESPGSTHRGFSELESLVGADRIISRTIVTPDRGSRRAPGGVAIADSVALDFLTSG
jgi:predicted AAA+ superfamily ATPase